MLDRDIGAKSRDGRKVVLVVDDDETVRMLAVDLFEEMGCEVIEASSGPEALTHLDKRPDVWLMFTDCRMPGMSGPELAEAAAQRWPKLRIVLVTGYHNMQAPGLAHGLEALRPAHHRARDRRVLTAQRR